MIQKPSENCLFLGLTVSTNPCLNMHSMKLSAGFSYQLNPLSYRYFWISCSSCISSKHMAKSIPNLKKKEGSSKKSEGSPAVSQCNTKGIAARLKKSHWPSKPSLQHRELENPMSYVTLGSAFCQFSKILCLLWQGVVAQLGQACQQPRAQWVTSGQKYSSSWYPDPKIIKHSISGRNKSL